jgi:hypothetical protein
MEKYKGYESGYDYVYFMLGKLPDYSLPLIKIGYSWNPGLRSMRFRTQLRGPVEILAAIPFKWCGKKDSNASAGEKNLHKRFSHLRVTGEWFKPEQELLGFIDGVNREVL